MVVLSASLLGEEKELLMLLRLMVTSSIILEFGDLNFSGDPFIFELISVLGV